jgi:hypothetical protein
MVPWGLHLLSHRSVWNTVKLTSFSRSLVSLSFQILIAHSMRFLCMISFPYVIRSARHLKGTSSTNWCIQGICIIIFLKFYKPVLKTTKHIPLYIKLISNYPSETTRCTDLQSIPWCHWLDNTFVYVRCVHETKWRQPWNVVLIAFHVETGSGCKNSSIGIKA